MRSAKRDRKVPAANLRQRPDSLRLDPGGISSQLPDVDAFTQRGDIGSLHPKAIITVCHSERGTKAAGVEHLLDRHHKARDVFVFDTEHVPDAPHHRVHRREWSLPHPLCRDARK